MQLKTRLKRNILIAFVVTLVSAGVVFATAGVQAAPESEIETVSSEQPAAQAELVTARSITPEIEPAPRVAAAETRNPDRTEPKTAKARALAEAMANGDHLLPVMPAPKQSAEQTPEQAAEQASATAADAQTASGTAEFDVPDDLVLLDSFIATAYYLTGTTATGTYTTVGRTLAVNPGIIPYGTHVWLYLEDGTFVGDYYAEDTGANMMEHPYVVDIYMGEDSYDACINWGARRVLIYVECE